jgi:chromosome segregation ATPase
LKDKHLESLTCQLDECNQKLNTLQSELATTTEQCRRAETALREKDEALVFLQNSQVM